MSNRGKYGPNTAGVEALIETIETITPKQIDKLGAAWDAALGAAWDAAWDAAWGAAWDAARGAALDAAWGAAWDAARGAGLGAARGAAWGAACALVVRDLISEEDFDLLYGPWKIVMEEE